MKKYKIKEDMIKDISQYVGFGQTIEAHIGFVDVETALKVSCNYYFYEVGYRMGIDTLSKYAKLFGLGRKTGIEIIGESSGTVASREYINKLTENDGKKRTWMIADTLSAAIGQIL